MKTKVPWNLEVNKGHVDASKRSHNQMKGGGKWIFLAIKSQVAPKIFVDYQAFRTTFKKKQMKKSNYFKYYKNIV